MAYQLKIWANEIYVVNILEKVFAPFESLNFFDIREESLYCMTVQEIALMIRNRARQFLGDISTVTVSGESDVLMIETPGDIWIKIKMPHIEKVVVDIRFGRNSENVYGQILGGVIGVMEEDSHAHGSYMGDGQFNNFEKIQSPD